MLVASGVVVARVFCGTVEGKYTMMRMRLNKCALQACAVASLSVLLASGCGSGDTDGGQGNDDLGLGRPLVSDGGFGSVLDIQVQDTTLAVGDNSEFLVFLRDPQGQPIRDVRIACNSEGGASGVGFLEPSSTDVDGFNTVFQQTNDNGVVSGVIVCNSGGSYRVECRGPQGFNVRDSLSVKCTGDRAGADGIGGGGVGNGSTSGETVATTSLSDLTTDF